MILNIRAERLKMKHTFGSILPQTAALLTLVLTLGLAYGNEYYSANAWNWWYVMLLPGMLCVLCCLGIKRECIIVICYRFLSQRKVALWLKLSVMQWGSAQRT